MKTLHSGNDEFPFVTTRTIPFTWTFVEAVDHEHPYVLTVTVDGHQHSEGYGSDIGETEAAAKAARMAREVYGNTHAGS